MRSLSLYFPNERTGRPSIGRDTRPRLHAARRRRPVGALGRAGQPVVVDPERVPAALLGVEQGLVGKDIEVVAVGDIVPADNLAYLLKYDSIQGRFKGEVGSKKSAADKISDSLDVGHTVLLESWVSEADGVAKVRYRNATWDADRKSTRLNSSHRT